MSKETPRARLAESLKDLKNNRDRLVDPDDCDRILQMEQAYDEENLIVDCPDEQKTKAATTRMNYVDLCRRIAYSLSLTEATTDDVNRYMQSLYNGRDDRKPISKGSIRNYQNAVRQFLYVHTDSEADPAGIKLFTNDKKTVNTEDMFTREEIQALRNAATTPRDRAIVDFLLYTGQRNTGLRTLRIKDLDLDNSRFKLNDTHEGLKGANENGRWRALLLAEASIRQYLQTDHPFPDNPDAMVFQPLTRYNPNTEPERPLNSESVSNLLRKIGKAAGIEKPTHPHALRHNFVTIAKRRGMDDSAIKHQIGHSPGSQVMETTYAHLSDKDHADNARDAFGLERRHGEADELTPEICPRCSADVPENASMCGVCHLEFTPDAKDRKDAADDTTHEGAKDAETDDEKEAIDELRDLLKDNPNLLDKIAD